MQPGEPTDRAHQLVPLKLAAEVVWARVYEGVDRYRSVQREDLLNSIGLTLLVMGEVYEFDKDPRRAPRQLTSKEIEGGIFHGGAKELHFLDGRQPRQYLAVTADAIAPTVDNLRQNL